ncbi:hypothetical protein ACFX13_028787 [Malus domestica]
MEGYHLLIVPSDGSRFVDNARMITNKATTWVPKEVFAWKDITSSSLPNESATKNPCSTCRYDPAGHHHFNNTDGHSDHAVLKPSVAAAPFQERSPKLKPLLLLHFRSAVRS